MRLSNPDASNRGSAYSTTDTEEPFFLNHASIIFILVFIVLPLTELYLLFKIAAVIGGWETFALVIVTGVVGASLARVQGIACLERIRASMNRAQMPTHEMASGVLILAASLLLITPGVITDLVGFTLLVPPLRHGVILLVLKLMKERGHYSEVHFDPASGKSRPPEQDTIDVEAKTLDEQDV